MVIEVICQDKFGCFKGASVTPHLGEATGEFLGKGFNWDNGGVGGGQCKDLGLTGQWDLPRITYT